MLLQVLHQVLQTDTSTSASAVFAHEAQASEAEQRQGSGREDRGITCACNHAPYRGGSCCRRCRAPRFTASSADATPRKRAWISNRDNFFRFRIRSLSAALSV